MAGVSAFDAVAIGVYSVPGREQTLRETLGEWRQFGIEPLVQVQPADWPRTEKSAFVNAETMLRRLLDEYPQASHLIFSEDDVQVAPELEVWLPGLLWLGAPVTLFLVGWQHYPQQLQQANRETVLPERIVRVRRMHWFWGSQALLLPRGLVEELLTWRSGRLGWDLHFAAYLRRHAIPLIAPVPNLVQHRGQVSTLHPDREEFPYSTTFGLPSDGSGISPPSDIDWCPCGDWEPDPRLG
ncbi:MAG: hypothetical protein DCC58_14970 [Chloroflexi bacterium]|nr:MAG: hypothetical protein DCC58_14970 [Chloroflexota bacterium]